MDAGLGNIRNYSLSFLMDITALEICGDYD